VNERTRENFEDFISLESYPNPFNSQTTIFYTIPKPQDIDISIFNVYGRKVVCLINDKKQEGCHRILWSGVDGEGKVLPSGIYLCRLMGENISLTRKICIVR